MLEPQRGLVAAAQSSGNPEDQENGYRRKADTDDDEPGGVFGSVLIDQAHQNRKSRDDHHKTPDLDHSCCRDHGALRTANNHTKPGRWLAPDTNWTDPQ